MYRIKETTTGSTIDEILTPMWVRVQQGTDYPPILAESLDDADGVILSDGETMLGIEGRNMQDYTPTVTVEEISAEPLLFSRIEQLERQVDKVYEAQTSESVSKAELDASYVEGVNSVE